MNLTAWVDVAIGLTLIYLGVGLFVTVINEYIAQLFSLRGRQLRKSLKTLITNEEVEKHLSDSPVLEPFFAPKTYTLPAYVDPRILGRLLIGGLALGETAENAYQQATESINALQDSKMKRQLQSLITTSGKTTEELVAAVTDWADRSLTALGDQYRRFLRTISFTIGFFIAVILNIDTIALTTHLYHDKASREAAVILAVQITERTSKETFDKCLALAVDKREAEPSCAALIGLINIIEGHNQSLGALPIGWSGRDVSLPLWPVSLNEDQRKAWYTRLGGWLLTALALSLGAPFWFDLLNKVVNIRHGMSKPEVQDKLTRS